MATLISTDPTPSTVLTGTNPGRRAWLKAAAALGVAWLAPRTHRLGRIRASPTNRTMHAECGYRG